MVCYAMLCCTVLRYAILYYAMLCCAMLGYAMLPTKAPTKAPAKASTKAPTKAPEKAPKHEGTEGGPQEATEKAPNKTPRKHPTKTPKKPNHWTARHLAPQLQRQVASIYTGAATLRQHSMATAWETMGTHGSQWQPHGDSMEVPGDTWGSLCGHLLEPYWKPMGSLM